MFFLEAFTSFYSVSRYSLPQTSWLLRVLGSSRACLLGGGARPQLISHPTSHPSPSVSVICKSVKLIRLLSCVYNLPTYSSPSIKTLGTENDSIGVKCTWVQVPTLAARPRAHYLLFPSLRPCHWEARVSSLGTVY